MAISDRINEMYTHVGDVYDTITNVDLPTNKNIQNIPSTMRSSYLEIMNNGIDKIWNNWEKVTGEGETLTLNSTEEAPMKINLKGNTSQETTTGKNLFNVENGTRTYGGQTYSIEDNIFKFSSTTVSGGVSAGVITPYTSYSFDTSSSYVWSLNKKSGNWTKGSAYPRVLIYIKYSDNTTSYSQINLNTDNQESASSTITFTSGKIPVSFAFGIYAPNGSLSNNVSAEYYVQLEENSTVTSYEPYTNGPSPNPDYPQDIHVVSGDNSIKVEGKNLFNPSSPNSLQGNTTLTAITDGIRATATNGGNWKLNVCNVGTTESLNGKTIRFKAKISNSSTNVGTYFLGYCDGDGNNRERISDTATSEQVVSMTVDNTTKTNVFLCLMTQNSATSISAGAYTDFINPILTINNDDMAYEPYQSASYPINLGVENLFDKDNANYVNGWIDGTTMRLNTINGNRMFYIPCKPNTTYTISRSVITSSFRTTTYDSTPFPTVTSSNVDYTVGSVLKNDNGTTLTITTNANAKYLVVHYGKIEDTNLNETLATIQVEYSSKQNSYTSYGTTPIELCKIGDYQDSIKKSTGKNLFDKDTIEEGKRLGSDGLPFTDASFDLSDYIKVDSNTQYTYSRGSNGSGSSAIAYYDSSKTFISRTMPIMDSNAREVVLTTPNNATYVRIADLKTTLDSMQFEKGSSSSSYEPYGKVWYLHKEIGKIVLDGTENWVYDSEFNYFRCPSYSFTDLPLVMTSANRASYMQYANNFTLNKSWSGTGSFRDTTDVSMFYPAQNTGYKILLRNVNFTTTSDFSNWLSSNNTLIYYVLATPTYTEITDSTLINQLEAVKRSYNGQTNISQVNNDKPFILDVTALKELTQ